MKKSRSFYTILMVLILGCAVMILVDGMLRPGYAVKSVIKIGMFFVLPAVVGRMDRHIHLRSLFCFQKTGFFTALILGIGIYALIVGGYFLFAMVIDFSPIVGALSQNAGVERDNFLLVALYISFVNSLLEEFFFRGFAFLNLKNYVSRGWAYGISALAFAAYHVSMMIGWFDFWIFALVMFGIMVGGCIFNILDEKQGTIYNSWLTHMFANFAINTIGFILMGP